jgi:hypothetical protein
MVQIHSPRPFLLEPIIYRHTCSGRPPGLGPGGPRFKSNRSDYAISRSLIDLHCDCVTFGNTRNLSNLSNTCPTTSPTDKESGYSEVRSGCEFAPEWQAVRFLHQGLLVRICCGEPELFGIK